MTTIIFTIFDIKADAYMEPWFLPTPQLAIRAFGDACNDPEHSFGKHLEDYYLVKIGSFDRNSGIIESQEKPQTVCSGLDMIRANNKEVIANA